MRDKDQVKFIVTYSPVDEDSVELMPKGMAVLLSTLLMNKTIFEKDPATADDLCPFMKREFTVYCDFREVHAIHEFIRNYADPLIYKSFESIELVILNKYNFTLKANEERYDDKRLNLLGFIATLKNFYEIM
ncbi:MAG: hypothetical protein ACRCTZ_19270 [Sarcina sp.]